MGQQRGATTPTHIVESVKVVRGVEESLTLFQQSVNMYNYV